MKKHLSLILLAVLAIACTNDDTDATNALETETVTIDTLIDFTEAPSSAFDNTNKGIYHGIIVTQDISVHGKIYVNIANNGSYNARVITTEDEEMTFYGTPSPENEEIVTFEGANGSFTYDVSDYTSPIATDVMINGISGYVQTVKDRSNQRASVTLGTYVDFNDPNFTGTWDLMTDGSIEPNYFLPMLTQTCTVTPSGAMIVDTVMESFTWSCFLPTDEVVSPIFARLGDPNNLFSANEFWAQDQILPTTSGGNAFYWLGVSTITTNLAGQTAGIFNFDLNNDGNTSTCQTFLGAQGIWFWNGRSGFIIFDDDATPIRSNVDPSLLDQFDFSGFELNTTEASELSIP